MKTTIVIMLSMVILNSNAFASKVADISCVTKEGRWYDFYKVWGELQITNSDGSKETHYDALSVSYVKELDSTGIAVNALYMIREEGELESLLAVTFPVGSYKGLGMMEQVGNLFCSRNKIERNINTSLWD